MTSPPSRDVVMLVLPTSVHVSVPGQASANFYSCGGVVYPIVEPHEQPGTAACAYANDDMLWAAGVVALVPAPNANGRAAGASHPSPAAVPRFADAAEQIGVTLESRPSPLGHE